MTAALLPYALAAGSAVIGGLAQSDVTSRQKNLTNQMTAYRSQRAANAESTIENFLRTQDPSARAAQQSSTQADLQSGLNNSVGAVQKFQDQNPIQGKVSQDYTDRVASNAGGMQDRISKAISQLSGIGTPGEVGMQNARTYGLAATDVDAQQRAAGNVSARYMDGINSQRPDPFLGFASQLLGGGSIAAGNGAFKPKLNAFGTVGPVGGTPSNPWYG